MSKMQLFILFSDDLILFCQDFAKIDPELHSSFMLNSRLIDLNERWTKVVGCFGEAMLEVEKDKDSQAAIRGKYSSTNKEYHECRAHIMELLTQKNKPIGLNSTQLPGSLNPHRSLPVPPCDMNDFEGSYEEWPTFRDLFSAIFKDNDKISSVEKLFYLRNKTKGEANNIVKRFALSDENFELAWQALSDRYENKRLLVDNQLKKLLSIPVSTLENSSVIRKVQITISDCLATLKAQQVNVENWDPFIVYICSTKLPDETLSHWEQSLGSRKDLPKWADMESFLISRCEVVECVTNIKGVKPKPPPQNTTKPHFSGNKSHNYSHNGKSHSKSNVYHADDSSGNSKPNCLMCKGTHALRNCQKFKDLKHRLKMNFVKKNKICFNCLSSTHMQKECTSSISCSYCQQSHHTLLHKHKNQNSGDTQPSSHSKQQPLTTDAMPASNAGATDSSQQRPDHTNAMYTCGRKNVLLPTAVVSVEHEGNMFPVRALIDPGSQSTFISERIQQRLGIPTSPASTCISAMGGKAVEKARKVCNFDLVSPARNFKVNVRALVLPKLTNLLPAVSFAKPDLSCFGNIELSDPNFNRSGPIDMLIGSDYIPTILIEGLKKSHDGTFVAQNTVFGWYICGPMPDTVQTYSTLVEIPEDELISNQLKLFWETEEIPKCDPISESDVFCEDLFASTTIRQDDGRYMVKLPFKKEFPKSVALGPSRYVAIKQYTRIESTLSKNPDLRDKYNEVLREYISLNHMSPADSLEKFNADSYYSFYLPHHAVLKPDSASTKVRVVFNASKKTRNGVSLNNVLYTGPTLQNDLMTTLLKWRVHRFVFNGDIEKMYRQILIHPEDRPFQKIVFRTTTDSPIQDFSLNTVTFGVNCAPYLAIRTLHQLSADYEASHPIAASIIKNDTYVDDILSGSHDLDDAKSALSQLIFVLSSAGFPLRKITANHPELLKGVPLDHRLSSDFLQFESASVTKTLGIRWNASQDCFYYCVKPVEPSASVTKRQILSISASWFDPAGWLTPITIRPKIILQELWKDKQDWDTCAKPLILNKWNAIVAELGLIEQIKIPRWISSNPGFDLQLHGFCDASERAYCACVYIRAVDLEGTITSHLLVAKSKVAPLQTLSLPRLELCGAVLLSKLVKLVTSNLNLSFSGNFFWCDSTITLAWLQKPPYLWKTFVANRVSEIEKNVGVSGWRHVPTDQNPADMGTREKVSVKDLISNTLWWGGPHWLKDNAESWPTTVASHSNPPEIRKIEVFYTCSESLELLDRFSSFSHALRVLSFAWRFCEKCKAAVEADHPKNSTRVSLNALQVSELARSVSDVTPKEIRSIKTRLIIAAQNTFYSDERKCLLENRFISKKSSLYALNPSLDSSLVMRVYGRLENASLSFNERHPIIIPEKSRFCDLLVRFYHQLLLHGEISLMTRMIRTEYYIPRLKSKLKACTHACQPCVLYKQKTRNQIMAALPPERVEFSPAFTIVGVDFCGPFMLKSSLVRNAPYLKGYVSVFVCFASKAIHLEICSDLTTEAFCGAFARFVGRRGLPKKVFSDNGRNFVGASRSLQKDYLKFMETSAQALSKQPSTQGVEWIFIPPNAPHMGGLWEAAVKSFKTHFTKAAGSHKFTYEEFNTLLVRIEAVLNSRPLSALSNDPTDLLPLTPAHLLCGRPLLSVPEPNKENASLVHRWEKLKALHHLFSRRWKSEYLLELQKRRKWQEPQPDFEVDDMVILKEDGLSPHEWRIGRILDVHPGRDGKVRVATVKTASGLFKRPIVKLVALPSAK